MQKPNDIKTIRETLAEIRKNLNDAKKGLSERIDAIDKTDEMLSISDKIYSHLENKTVPQVLTQSGIKMTNNLVPLSKEIVATWESSIEKESRALSAMFNTSQYIAGTALSGATLSDPRMTPTEWTVLENQVETAKDREYVSRELILINQRYSDMYNNAWKAKAALQTDKARQPLANVREVVYQLLHEYAPDEEIKKQSWFIPNPESKTGVTHGDRVKYIASKVKDSSLSYELISMTTDYTNLINQLSKTLHKHGSIEEQEAINDMYRADSLLRMLLKCLRNM